MKTTAIAETMGNWRRPSTQAERDRLSIDCIRTLSMDAVQQANSGHPGTPMALARLVYTRRDASGKVLSASARNIPWLLGGSADLAPSTKTTLTIEGVEDGVARGAYVLGDAPGGNSEVVLIGSGSELSLCVNAHELAEGICSRVVSMPSRNRALPPDVTPRVAVEQASTFGWERYVGRSGRSISMKTFDASAPLKEPQRKFGFEPGRVTQVAKALVARGERA